MLRIKTNFDLTSVFFFVLGFFFINFSFLDDSLRRVVAFSFFGVAILFSLKRSLITLSKGRVQYSQFFGFAIILYAVFYTYLIGYTGDYGQNKFYYFILIILLSFVFIPPVLLSRPENLSFFVTLLVLCSLCYCFVSVVFSSIDGGRRGESGLNPAVLARISMLLGIYALIKIYFSGVTFVRLLMVVFSCLAVLITGTKTPIPVAILCVFMVTVKKVDIKTLLKSFLAFIVLCVSAYFALKFFVPENIASRVLDISSLSREAQSTEGNRFDLYTLSVDVIVNHPFGNGFGSFANFHRYILVPHNVFLENAVELGLASALMFFLYSLFVLFLTRYKYTENIDFAFVKALYIYMFFSSLFGGETTIQSLLFYLSGILIFLNYKSGFVNEANTSRYG